MNLEANRMEAISNSVSKGCMNMLLLTEPTSWRYSPVRADGDRDGDLGINQSLAVRRNDFFFGT